LSKSILTVSAHNYGSALCAVLSDSRSASRTTTVKTFITEVRSNE